MNSLRFMGLFALIPATLLLTVSFFVLLTLNKVQEKRLRAFGFVIVGLLWLGTVLVSSMGIYVLATGRHPMMSMMKQMMRCPMYSTKGTPMPMMRESYKGMMMKNKMPAAVSEQKAEPTAKP